MKHNFCLKPYLLQNLFGIIAVYVTSWRSILFKKYKELVYEKCQILFILLQLNRFFFQLSKTREKNSRFHQVFAGAGIRKNVIFSQGRDSDRSTFTIELNKATELSQRRGWCFLILSYNRVKQYDRIEPTVRLVSTCFVLQEG